MQIGGIGQRYTNPLLELSTDETGSKSHDKSTSALGASAAASSASSSSFREILSRYDVQNISPSQYSDLIGELHSAGELSDTEFKELTQLRAELDRQVEPHENLNLLDFLRQKLDELKDQQGLFGELDEGESEQQTNAAADAAQRQLAWLEKFAAVQDGGGEPLDLFA